ncbi:MAG: hypothetical protein H7X97_08615, partial [Opitutaceae bacterium]|nr:hypothetical protein [Verrucomicrobiales bacterium]
QGNTRQLTFRDYRKWLAWDKAYCTFNEIDDRLVNGVRARRYRHILPSNFNTLRRTWTNAPLTAAQIIQYVLVGPGIETPWTVGYIDSDGDLIQDAYHPNMARPVYGVDCFSGKPISTLLSEICDELGLLFTLMPNSTVANRLFNIVFAMKGVDGPDVTFPADSNQRQSGTELSGNPTRVRVLGDRNVYQVHNCTLEADWNTNWSAFYDVNLFVEYVFQNLITWNTLTDPEQIVARQQAYSLAMEMTLRQFDDAISAGGNYLDYRKYAGRSRNDMPCVLYIQNLLFRCFRLPSGFHFNNTYGQALYSDSFEIQDKLIAAVSHDPVTGVTYYDNTATENVDGNAYVIVKGYQVGKDMFDSIKPERFNIAEWASAQDVWQKIDVRIEDSGDSTSPLIIFDEPVIRSEDLVTLVDGYAVFQTTPTITVPPVKAVLTFAGERFSWLQSGIQDAEAPPSDPVMGTQVHDEVMNVGGLGGEFVSHPADGLYEIYYADGKSCRYKAIEYANNFLDRQWLHAKGSFVKPVDDGAAYALHGKINSLTLQHGPSGSTVTVELTNERGRINYVPERDLDRAQKFNTLFPGQKEIKQQANAAKKIAAVARVSKESYKLLTDAFHGNFVDQGLAKPTAVAA